MSAKNYPLKFFVVILIAAVCLWTLATRGMNEGIDIRGGHTLMYEVQIETGDVKDIVQQTIAILKKRVDPQGLASLEWQPTTGNRFEVRMPAGDPRSQQQENQYNLALEELEQKNVQRSELRHIEESSGDERQQEIEKAAKGDDQRKALLAQLAEAYDRTARGEKVLQDKRAAYQKAQAATSQPSVLQPLEKELEAAENDQAAALQEYEDKLAAVRGTNISRGELEAVLKNYVSPAEERALEKAGKKQDTQRRMEVYHAKLEELAKSHPARKGELDKVVALYEAWSNDRRPLGDPADLRRLIAKAGVLEFRIAPQPPGAEGLAMTQEEAQKYVDILNREGPDPGRKRNDPFMWFAILSGPKEFGTQAIVREWRTRNYVLLYNQPGYEMLQESGNWKLKSAGNSQDQYGRRAVAFTFDPAGAKLFWKLTDGNVGHYMAILLDNEAYSAPRIQSAISDRGEITGSFSEAEQRELVRTLNAGALPARVKFLSLNTFGPAMGRINRDMAIRAAFISLAVVAAFMLTYYMILGMVANVALMLNILMVLGMMSMLDAVFTLPGIAGVILTIGIAVDANVLLYERLRQDQAVRESMRLAINDTYKATWPVIRDANITTIISCLILGWVGTEELRGFAITLGLGVVFNIFCALYVTRWLIEPMAERRHNRPYAMLKLISEEPKIRWMAKKHYFWAISGFFIVLGIASLIWQGKDIWGIEFSAGTKAVLRFKDDALVRGADGTMRLANDKLVRDMFLARARQDGHDKLAASARVEEQIDPGKADHFLRDYDKNHDGQVSLEEWQAARKNVEFFRAIDKLGNQDGMLSRDEIRKHVPTGSYQITTTEIDVASIRKVAGETFGSALDRRASREYQLVKGQNIEGLGGDVRVGEAGFAKISEKTGQDRLQTVNPKNVNPEFRDAMVDYDGGELVGIQNVTPPISVAEFKQRIREMQSQPDFAGLSSEVDVLCLKKAGEEDTYSSFAVLVAMPDPQMAENADAWEQFAGKELPLLHAALSREEAMVATNFDPAIAGETAQLAIVALVLSWIGIIVYLAVTFRGFSWGFAAVLALVHDVVITVGMVAASGWLSQTFIGRALGIESFKIDLTLVAAILTIIGYSVNDTIVVFSYVRERPIIARSRGWSLKTLDRAVISRTLDEAINKTLSRTLITSFTAFMVVLVMYIWGGPGIHAFNYAMLIGIVFGTYSSIAIASPILLGVRGMFARTSVPVQDKPRAEAKA